MTLFVTLKKGNFSDRLFGMNGGNEHQRTIQKGRTQPGGGGEPKKDKIGFGIWNWMGRGVFPALEIPKN